MAQARTYKCYQRLSKALARDKFKNPGKLSTLFLDTFVHDDGKILQKKLHAKGFALDMTMDQWRSPFIAKGWLIFERGDKYQRHFPGPKLFAYINEEKISSMEMATTKDVHSGDEEIMKEVKKLSEEFSAMKKMLGEIIAEKDPPWTEDKEREWIHGNRHLKVLGNQA